MSGARRSEGLLPRAGVLRAIDLVDAGVRDSPKIVSALQTVHGSTLSLCANTVELLVEIGVFVVADDARLEVSPAREAYESAFLYVRSLLLDYYFTILGDVTSGQLFQLSTLQELRVNSVQLPGRKQRYPYALLEFDILTRNDFSDEFWSIATDVIPLFMEMLRTSNMKPPVRPFPLEKLKAMKAAQEGAGQDAEQWVLAFEQRRLASHPFVELVRLVSDEDTGAGYDLASFDNPQTLLHDRFIEVKSYESEYSFFWSEGEMASARQLGMSYWLYLVDRRGMKAPSYAPEMIPDPINFFVERNPLGWEVSPTGFKFKNTFASPST